MTASNPVTVPLMVESRQPKPRCDNAPGASKTSSPVCQWCTRPFIPGRTGGHDQRFCSPSCRRAFHAAVRGWALAEMAAGRLTVPQIRNGLPATRTLATEDGMPSLIPEADQTLDALLTDLLAALPEDVWLALPDQILDQISDYLDSAG